MKVFDLETDTEVSLVPIVASRPGGWDFEHAIQNFEFRLEKNRDVHAVRISYDVGPDGTKIKVEECPASIEERDNILNEVNNSLEQRYASINPHHKPGSRISLGEYLKIDWDELRGRENLWAFCPHITTIKYLPVFLANGFLIKEIFEVSRPDHFDKEGIYEIAVTSSSKTDALVTSAQCGFVTLGKVLSEYEIPTSKKILAKKNGLERLMDKPVEEKIITNILRGQLEKI